MCNEFGIRGINLKPNYVCGVTFQKTYLGISLRTNEMNHVITIIWFPQRNREGAAVVVLISFKLLLIKLTSLVAMAKTIQHPKKLTKIKFHFPTEFTRSLSLRCSHPELDIQQFQSCEFRITVKDSLCIVLLHLEISDIVSWGSRLYHIISIGCIPFCLLLLQIS